GEVGAAAHFEDAVVATIARGGETDASGALAGAIAGARFGASGIPQGLIDGLDARIYLSMAAPWFYRTALRRAGTVIDLRAVE
nr:ADP-ribosylglycohydrolase family protein [Chloroflexia bacterium]